MFLQFAQVGAGRLDLMGLQNQAARHFGAETQVRDQNATLSRARFTLTTARHGSATFELSARSATASDYARLDAAEAANRSHGMAALGRRCPFVWEVVPEAETPTGTCYYFGALLASVALGPLLPNDGSGLYGVRSARQLAETR